MSMSNGPSPLEAKLSTSELFNRIHAKINEQDVRHHELVRMINEVEARFDTAFPGSDLGKHHSDHTRIHNAEVNHQNMMQSLRDKSIVGGGLTFVVFVALVVGWAMLKAARVI